MAGDLLMAFVICLSWKGDQRAIAKLCVAYVSLHVTLLVNRCIHEATFPDLLTRVVVLFKKGLYHIYLASEGITIVKVLQANCKDALGIDTRHEILTKGLPKPPNCVPHRILIMKLKTCGLDETVYKLVGSCFTYRMRRIKVDGSVEVTGVYFLMHGSILESFIFNMFTNDLALKLQKYVL